jgi:hypothetical protein
MGLVFPYNQDQLINIDECEKQSLTFMVMPPLIHK